MRKIKKGFLAFLASIVLLSSLPASSLPYSAAITAEAHSGRTDARGGHLSLIHIFPHPVQIRHCPRILIPCQRILQRRKRDNVRMGCPLVDLKALRILLPRHKSILLHQFIIHFRFLSCRPTRHYHCCMSPFRVILQIRSPIVPQLSCQWNGESCLPVKPCVRRAMDSGTSLLVEESVVLRTYGEQPQAR